MKHIVIMSLFLNVASIYVYFRPQALTEEYAILFHIPTTILLIAYLLYLINKGYAK